jgi:hypothetical protein
VVKLLLFSVVIALFAIPLRYSKDSDPERGLRVAVRALLLVLSAYILLIWLVYPMLN